MIGPKKTNINDIRVKYWFNREKEARLTFKYGNNEITFLNEAFEVVRIPHRVNVVTRNHFVWGLMKW
jgi:hypothetical protein